MLPGETHKTYIGIVDDDESIRRSLGRLLRAVGMEAVAYPSAEALLADDRRPRFDCLVLDFQLGGMSGIELNQQLAMSGSTIPVIFLSAHDEPDMREQALRTPCRAYLNKTDSGEQLLASIRKAVHHSTSALSLSEPTTSI